VQQPMTGEDYMHIASLTDLDWHPICMCSRCGTSSCDDVCCKCTGKTCATLLHTWHVDGLEAYWPYYAYYKHGEDVVKFYYTYEHGLLGSLGTILAEWIANLHQMEATCTAV
jgi:hypothetical protein